MENKLYQKNDDGLVGLLPDITRKNKAHKEVKAAILARVKQQTPEEKQQIRLNAVKYKMMEYLDDDSDKLIPLGTFIKDYLKVINIRQKAFAAYIEWNPGNLTKLLNGTRRLNHELAMILGNTFGVAPSVWLRIQDKNELVQLRMINRNKYKKYSLDRLFKVASLL